MEAVSLLVAVVCVVLACFMWNLVKRSISNRPPGPLELPILGHMHLIGSRSLHLLLKELSESYGDIFSLKLGSRQSVVLGSREAIHEAFVKKARAFAGRPDLPTFKYTRNGQTGLSLCDYSDEYVNNRKMTLKAIHHFVNNAANLNKVFGEEALKMITLFDQYADCNKSIAPLQEFQKVIPSIFLNMMFGLTYEYNNERFQEASKIYRKWFEVAEADNPADFFRFLEKFPNQRLQVAQECGVYFEKFILSMMDLSGSSKHCLFDEFKTGHTNSNEEKLSEPFRKSLAKVIADIVGGGFDTAAATLSWAVLYLNQHQEVLKKCREEINSVTNDRMISPDLKSQTPYFCATIYDILRLSSVAPLGLVRKVMHDVNLSSYLIQKDTMVLANHWAANHDPQFWEKPEALHPNHFLTESGELDTGLAREISTFSSGVRRCPGDQIGILMLFVVLGTLIKNYDISLTQPPKDMIPLRGVTLKPKHYEITLKLIS